MKVGELQKSILGQPLLGQPSKLTKGLKDLFFPVSCLGCSKPEVLVCDQCLWSALKPKVKRFYPSTRPPRTSLKAIYGAFDYHDPLSRTLITKFKYQGVTELAGLLAKVLSVLIRSEISLPAVLIPVPSDFWRRLERGYNQTELLSLALSRQTGWPAVAKLKKRQPTPSQTELDKKQRKKNLRGKFVWRGTSLKGKTVVIIDDVTTTGATLKEAARALGRAKPSSIFGLVVAFD